MRMQHKSVIKMEYANEEILTKLSRINKKNATIGHGTPSVIMRRPYILPFIKSLLTLLIVIKCTIDVLLTGAGPNPLPTWSLQSSQIYSIHVPMIIKKS